MGAGGADNLSGGLGVDRLYGDDGGDTLAGNDGDDQLFGMAGDDVANGGAGADGLFGDTGADQLHGGDGDDRLEGWRDNDALFGDLGADVLAGEDGSDTLNGGDGDDVLYGDRATGSTPLAFTEQQIISGAEARIGAGSFAVLYQGEDYDLAGLKAADHDMLIVPLSRVIDSQNNETLWTAAEVAQIQATDKLLIGYMDLAKINDFTGMWRDAWTTTTEADGALTAGAPAWLGDLDPADSSTRLVDFWVAGWKEVLYARIDTMIGQGFDGVLLDDVLEYYVRNGGTPAEIAFAARAMRDLIIDLRAHATQTLATARPGTDPDDFLFIQNGGPYIIPDSYFGGIEDVARSNAYYGAIDAFLAENYFGMGATDAIAAIRANFGGRGITMLALESNRGTEQARIAAMREAVDKGFLPYATSTGDYGVLDQAFKVGFGDVQTPGDDVLTGGIGNDVLDGGAGADSLNGEAGVDAASYGTAGAGVRVSLLLSGAVQDTIGAGLDRLTAIENLYGSAFADVLTGNGGANELRGGAGNDVLDGGAAADVLEGGLGDDVLIGGSGIDTATYERATAAVTVLLSRTTSQNTLGAGLDRLDGVENLTGSDFNDKLRGDDAVNTLKGGAGDDNLSGAGGADVLQGGDGNDILDGQAGADVMTGGAGNDAYYIDDVGDRVTEVIGGGAGDILRTAVDFVIGAAVELEFVYVTSTTGAQVTGNNMANRLFGGTGQDRLLGLVGADVLDGMDGADLLDGGGGNDTLYGRAGADHLLGGVSDDVLDGGEGADRMEGGAGHDIFIVADATDVVIELLNGGTDTVRSSVSWTLGANLENLTLLGATAIDGAGNELVNTLTGNTAANVMDGRGGADILRGGGGNDTLLGGDANDNLFGEVGNDRLEGGAGIDTLTGGDGADVLLGGAGGDRLSGGAGADRFAVDASSIVRSALGGLRERDQVSDLNFAQGDRIDLSAIDANVLTAGDDAFVFVASFTGVAGQATRTLNTATNSTLLQLDVDGDAKADYEMLIVGNQTGGAILTGGSPASAGGWML